MDYQNVATASIVPWNHYILGESLVIWRFNDTWAECLSDVTIWHAFPRWEKWTSQLGTCNFLSPFWFTVLEQKQYGIVVCYDSVLWYPSSMSTLKGEVNCQVCWANIDTARREYWCNILQRKVDTHFYRKEQRKSRNRWGQRCPCLLCLPLHVPVRIIISN